MLPGDEINVYSKKVFKSEAKVFIEGAIKNPGAYRYRDKMTLKDLLLQAGGEIDFNYNYKIELSRIEPGEVDENKFSKIILFESLKKITTEKYKIDLNRGRDSLDFLLMPLI